jgi:O-antigen ligase
LMLAASRGGLLGLIAATLFIVVRSPRPVRNLLTTGFLLALLLLLAPASPLQRILHPSHSDIEASDRRVQLWKVGLTMVRANPLFGIGVGNYKPFMSSYMSGDTQLDAGIAHNSYLEIATEMGFLGLTIFVGFLVCTFHSVERTRKVALLRGYSAIAQLSLGLEAGLVGYMVSAFFISAEYQKLFWLSAFLVSCLSSIIQSRIRRESWEPATYPTELSSSVPARLSLESKNGNNFADEEIQYDSAS